MNVVRPPGVRMVAPGVGAWLDRGEAVAALRIGDAAAGAGEVRVEWCRMLVDHVHVAAGGVRLPDLYQRVRDGTAVLVKNTAGDHDTLADWLADVALGQVGVVGQHALMTIDRAGQLGERVRQNDERLLRRAQAR